VSLLIAIDGPAAAGKGTLAKRLAAHFALPHLDTGLLYRAVGRRVLDIGGNPSDAETALAAVRALHPRDLERPDLRGPEADQAAASVASIPAVRSALLKFQRAFASGRGAVMDGRDIGTIICPDATVKLFVTASVEARARRRWLELRTRGETIALTDVITQIRERDAQDRARAIAPLVPAADAIILDTTSLDADATLSEALRLLRDVRGIAST
jgi:cytidylate kinase